jgi:pilus assembly protein FimV
VHSRDAISEPFVSFLIDVNWPRGRLLREYTVLLDPPAMLAPRRQPAAAPIAAPTTAPARRPERRQPAEPQARCPPGTAGRCARLGRIDLTRSRAATRSTASRARSRAATRGDPAHDDRAFPRQSRGVQRQHQLTARRRDPARAALERDREHRDSEAASEVSQQNAAWRAAAAARSPAA